MKMQPERRHRIDELSQHRLDLPPAFRLVALREVGDAFAYACAHAGTLGAGTLVFVGRFDIAEFAVILEPDEPLESARRVLYAGMVSLVDALASDAPPQKAIHIGWPDAIYVDGGLVGGGRLGWPSDADEQAVPEWVVFGAEIRIATARDVRSSPYLQATTLEEEGFARPGAESLVEGFARRFMEAIDTWQAEGFAAVARRYISLLKPMNDARRTIATNGDLQLTLRQGSIEHQAFRPALRSPSWRNRLSDEPRR